MMHRFLITLVLLGASFPVAAQTAADRADARCILVMTIAARNPAQKEASGRGQFYYYGRLAARSPTVKLGPLLLAESKVVVTQQKLQAELARCTGELTMANAAVRDGLAEVEAAARQAVKPGVTPPK
jgi:hypothetical protein